MIGIVAIAIGAASLVLNIVGVAIPYWLYDSVDGGTINVGLWQACGSSGGNSQCVTIPSEAVTSTIQAVRAMEILAVLILFVACVSIFLKQFVMKENPTLLKLAGPLAIASGAFAIVGCVIFAAKAKDDLSTVPGLTLHAGFGLCIVAAIGAIVTAILSFMVGRE